jgi:transcriptional regulator with XRE-family HTH domain
MQRVFRLDRLADMLEEKNMTESDFARAAGLDRAYVYRVIRDKAKPGLRFLFGLWTAFPDLPLDYFVPTIPDKVPKGK